MIRLLIADDHTDVRTRLRRIVDAVGAFQVVAEADNGHAVLEAVHRHPIDVALVDIAMPGPPFARLIREIRQARAETRVLVVTVSADPAYATEALRAGASGLLAKERAADELAAAIRRVHAGSTYIRLAPALADPPRRPPEPG